MTGCLSVSQVLLCGAGSGPAGGHATMGGRQEPSRHLDQWTTGRAAPAQISAVCPGLDPLCGTGRTNLVAVKWDNHDNPLTGPKPWRELDVNRYGGLYGPGGLTDKESLHGTDPLLLDRPAGGGVVAYPLVTEPTAIVRIQTHVGNAGTAVRHVH